MLYYKILIVNEFNEKKDIRLIQCAYLSTCLILLLSKKFEQGSPFIKKGQILNNNTLYRIETP